MLLPGNDATDVERDVECHVTNLRLEPDSTSGDGTEGNPFIVPKNSSLPIKIFAESSNCSPAEITQFFGQMEQNVLWHPDERFGNDTDGPLHAAFNDDNRSLRLMARATIHPAESIHMSWHGSEVIETNSFYVRIPEASTINHIEITEPNPPFISDNDYQFGAIGEFNDSGDTINSDITEDVTWSVDVSPPEHDHLIEIDQNGKVTIHPIPGGTALPIEVTVTAEFTDAEGNTVIESTTFHIEHYLEEIYFDPANVSVPHGLKTDSRIRGRYRSVYDNSLFEQTFSNLDDITLLNEDTAIARFAADQPYSDAAENNNISTYSEGTASIQATYDGRTLPAANLTVNVTAAVFTGEDLEVTYIIDGEEYTKDTIPDPVLEGKDILIRVEAEFSDGVWRNITDQATVEIDNTEVLNKTNHTGDTATVRVVEQGEDRTVDGTISITLEKDGNSASEVVSINTAAIECILDSISISPATRTFSSTGSTANFTATGHYEPAGECSTQTITGDVNWSIDPDGHDTVFTVNNSDNKGRVTSLSMDEAHASQTNLLQATRTNSESTVITGQATLVREQEPELSSITISPSGIEVSSGDEVNFQATANFTAGKSPEDWTASEDIQWSVECTTTCNGTLPSISNAEGTEGKLTVPSDFDGEVTITVTPGLRYYFPALLRPILTER